MLQNSNYLAGGAPPAPAKPRQFSLKVARKIGTKCRYCNRHFYPENKTGPVPKYCSRSCESKAYRARKYLAELQAAKEKAR